MKASRTLAISNVARLLLGALILLGGAALVTAFPGIAGSGDDDIADSLNQLAAYQGALASRPQLEAELQRIQSESASVAGLVPGDSAPLAAANIQNAIRLIVARIGGEIRSSQNLPAATADGFEKIEIAYDIALPADRLKDLIYQIETHTPFFFLDNVQLQMPQGGRVQNAKTDLPRIDAHWVVRGYRWTGSP